ncbi:MAG: TetR family transcriptional regulator [Acidimicrobiales bacterium]
MEGSRWRGSEETRGPWAPELSSRGETSSGPAGPAPALSRLADSTGSEDRFTISVLAEKTATPVPTIHHYRHLGLLPEATELASNRFLYDKRHVEALNVIRLLREQRNLPLEAIREMLPELLAFEREGDFSLDTWDDVIAAYLERSGPAVVSARLVAAAREAFAQHGYAGVNVADICSAADVAKGTFYRYFDSKEEIFLAAARSTVDAVGEQLDELPAPMSEHQAIEKLKLLLGPMAPLLLEVATGELRHQPNLVGVAGVITAGLASRVVPRLRTRGKAARVTARRVVDAALVGLLRPTLESASSSQPPPP